MSLALYSPHPRPLALGGRTFAGRPGTIGDLFALADLAAELAGDPLDGLDPADPDSLRACATAAAIGGADLADAARTVAGHLAILAAVLRGSGLDGPDLEAIYSALTPAEWEAVETCFWRPDPAVMAYALIDAHLGVNDPPEGVSWEQAVAEVAAERGWPETLAMPLPLFRLLRSGGKRQLVNPDSSHATQLAREAFWKAEAATCPAASGGPPPPGARNGSSSSPDPRGA